MYLEELQIFYLVQLFRTYTVGLVLGSSTIVLVFYLYLIRKDKIEPVEKKIMHLTVSVLRTGMVLILFSELSDFIYNYHIDNFIYWTDNPELLMRLTVYFVVILNAFAMHYQKISMWLGPVVAAGSWYAYFFFSTWIETESTYLVLVKGYIIWLLVVFLIINSIRVFITRNQKQKTKDDSIVSNTVNEIENSQAASV